MSYHVLSCVSGNFAVDRPRLPVGYVTLRTHGALVQGTRRTHLYNGSTTLTASTDSGQLRAVAFVNARFDLGDVQVYDVVGTGGVRVPV